MELQQVLPPKEHAASGHAVGGVAGQQLGKGALATAVAAHHRVNFTGTHREVDTLEDRLILHTGMEITDLKHQWGVGANHSVAIGRGRNREKSINN